MRYSRFIVLLLCCALIFAACGLAAAEGSARCLNLYWQRDADIAKSDVWVWYGSAAGHGMLFEKCDYGYLCRIDVPDGVDEVGFIVRTGCSDPGGSAWGTATKDVEEDRFAVLTGTETNIYLRSGDARQYYSNDGGKTLNEILIFKSAAMVAMDQIRYTIAPAVRIESLEDIAVYDGDERLEIASLSSLNNKVVMGNITMKEPLDIRKTYTLTIKGYGTKTVVPTDVFDTKGFTEQYLYDGDDLGAVVQDGQTTFKVWAPTASRVVLDLYEAGDSCDAYACLDMTYTDHGVWQAMAPCGHGTYYTYTVTTGVGTQTAVDPYAKTAGVNGDRGMVLEGALTDPVGFEKDTWYPLVSYQQASIWEAHVRDFSIANAASAYPGKYLAFTETGLVNAAGVPVGMDHVKALGVTHIHLQPVYDYATVDETTCAQYNWGYDPKNYNVPEGSYATDPYHGEVRVNEFKQMVAAIHAQGMGVVMDVVYNHTADANSNLNKIVPYYYYRYTPAGENSNGSGCGNETASNRAMFRKYMVDSVLWWAKEYHVDGFRFDLMALHDVTTMQQIEQALHAVNPSAIIYGEGWTGGTSALNENFQARQANISKIKVTEGAAGGVAVFNDAIRDGLKGSVFDVKDRGYISGNVTRMNAGKVAFGLGGGVKNFAVSWKVNDAAVINYTSCHDNLTLYDKLMASCPDTAPEDLLKIYRLSAACVYLAKGTPFVLAGEEMLRTKQGDENSYMSSDEINHIDWESLTPGSDALEMSRYYAMLNTLRREKAYLTQGDVSVQINDDLTLMIVFSMDGEITACAGINPYDTNRALQLPEGNFEYVRGGEGEASGTVTVQPLGWVLLER